MAKNVLIRDIDQETNEALAFLRGISYKKSASQQFIYAVKHFQRIRDERDQLREELKLRMGQLRVLRDNQQRIFESRKIMEDMLSDIELTKHIW